VEAIRRRVQDLSLSAEYSIVLVGALGYFCLGSLVAVLFPRATPPITQAHLVRLLAYESIVLVVLWAFLRVRGWTPKRIGLKANTSDPFIGIGLAIADYAAYITVWWLAVSLGAHPNYAGTYRELAVHGLALPTVIAASILNPIYEELFVCGYVVTVAKEHNRITAGINISVAIRLLYHLYQGSVGVLGIIPSGLIFALWYARTGRLWPVVVAHALFDVTGLLQFVDWERH
jgi:CAAX protease family protein